MIIKNQFVSTSALAIAIAVGYAASASAQQQPTPAPQQPAADTSGTTIEQIVVTARRRAESLQRVPVAVTAVTATQIAQNKIVNVNDLAQLTPSLTFEASSYSAFGSLVGIRGQKTGDTILSQTPSVGIYIDDVYAPSTIGTGVGNLYDTKSIEVLKGPQGTLYGRNTTGGAIKIDSNPPDYSGFNGSAKVGFGNYSSNEDALVLNMPIVDQKVALRAVLERDYHSGFGHDDTNNRPLGDEDAKSARLALRLDPNDNLNITVRGNYQDARSGGVVTNLEAIEPVFAPNGTPTFSPTLLNVGLGTGAINPADLGAVENKTATLAQYNAVIAGQQQAYNDLLPYLRKGYNVNYSTPESNRMKDDGGSINISYRVNSNLTLKSITSYQYAYQLAYDEVDGTPYKILEGPGDVTSLDQLTQEFQATGNAFDDKLQYTAGFYFYHLTGNDDSPGEIELPFLNPAGSPVDTRDHLFDTSKAGYAQATYTIIPGLHFTGGIRYTDEDTELLSRSTAGADVCNLPAPAGIGGVPCSADFKNSFKNWSYTAGLDWQATRDVMLYAKTSRGFKAGGQNQRGSTSGGFDAFAPEVVTDYEVGVKSEFLDHRLRLDVDGYHSDYTNIQRTVLSVTPTNQTITEVQNAASATIDGVEVEFTARPIHSLILSVNGAYTYPKYQKYLSGGVDLSGNVFQDQPRWQGNISATYTHDVSVFGMESTFTGTINQSYQSTVNYAPDNLSVYDNNYPIQAGYGLLDAHVSLEVPKYDMTIEAWAKNLTDRKYLTGVTDVTAALGVGVGYLSAPRTFGFDVIKRF
jgi:iron complex outermembrane receptor protein